MRSKGIFILAITWIVISLFWFWAENIALGIIWLCAGVIKLFIALVRRSKEKKSILQVSNSKESVVYKIDGYIITAGSKCDKMVLIKDSSNWTQIFVELKGKDLHHAIEQLESTLQNKMLAHSANKEKRARIVAASFPSNRGDMTMEKVKIRFKKIYKCDLRGLKSGQPDKI